MDDVFTLLQHAAELLPEGACVENGVTLEDVHDYQRRAAVGGGRAWARAGRERHDPLGRWGRCPACRDAPTGGMMTGMTINRKADAA